MNKRWINCQIQSRDVALHCPIKSNQGWNKSNGNRISQFSKASLSKKWCLIKSKPHLPFHFMNYFWKNLISESCNLTMIKFLYNNIINKQIKTTLKQFFPCFDKKVIIPFHDINIIFQGPANYYVIKNSK